MWQLLGQFEESKFGTRHLGPFYVTILVNSLLYQGTSLIETTTLKASGDALACSAEAPYEPSKLSRCLGAQFTH